ncbi:MAG TPA: succinyl-diaminopimelate desuccinylase [Steroidobacteraceae bacterium]|jgi:succinyl-diaminopimelate desuccinylase|nr:succinyl-diaminopimelate desuccinylase [Steroidobacteraceae bacterium]
MSRTLELTVDLMGRASVTPADEGCQNLMMGRLAAVGFRIEKLNYGNVENFWARRGTTGPVLCFAGHTDVVPTGPLEEWRTKPFEPTVRDGVLYGRGAADMKSGLAAMVTATEEFVTTHPGHRGTIAFLITSDEEGPSVDGTKRVVETLLGRGDHIDWCIVGEPSSEAALGDTIKIGRRGSLSGRLTVHGTQGHIAYPHLAVNPIHTLAPALAELTSREWDQGNEHFQPTTFQVSNLNAGTGAPNVIPGELKARFNLRYSPVQSIERLKQTVEDILRRHEVNFSLEWYVSGEPFYTPQGRLSDAVCKAVAIVAGKPPKLSTGGGTSDGRFIAALGAQIVELGVINASIHKVNEEVRAVDIDDLHRMYVGVLEQLLA